MITTNPCGFVYNRCNGALVRAQVSHLLSLKAGVKNQFLTPAFSHLMLIPITAIIKSA